MPKRANKTVKAKKSEGQSKFDEFIIKRYRYWTLYIHENQSYLGRAFLWLNRPGDMQRLTHLTIEETLELRFALGKYEDVLRKLWSPDHMNYAWLGNHMHQHGGHGHMHIIPRYKSKREGNGRLYMDYRWGKNYAPAPKRRMLRGEVQELKKIIQDAFKK